MIVSLPRFVRGKVSTNLGAIQSSSCHYKISEVPPLFPTKSTTVLLFGTIIAAEIAIKPLPIVIWNVSKSVQID